MAKQTAEQKLLKIIESAEGPQPPAQLQQQSQDVAQQMAASVKGVGLPSIPVSSFLSFLFDLLQGKTSVKQAPVSFGIREFNRVLFVIIVIMAAIFVKNFMSGLNFSKQEVQFMIEKASSKLSDSLLPTVQAVSEYIAIITQRNIFQPYEKKEIAEETEEIPSTVKRITERTKNYKLVGISWLDSAESASAMFENTETGITHFLKTGETINDVKVKAIYADTVIVGFEGEEKEFRL